MNSDQFFWENGYCVVSDFLPDSHHMSILPENMYSTGHMHWSYDGTDLELHKEELQVSGTFSRHCYPPYRSFHQYTKDIVQRVIRPPHLLYPTYYFDRIYYTGSELVPHIDWEPCEISVTVQLESTLLKPWSFYIETLKGEEKKVDLYNGGAIIYMGDKCRHWREPMGGGKKDYHHQLFLHYVVKDGECFNVLKSKGHM